MFDGSFPEPGALRACPDAGLIDAIRGWSTAAAAAEGRRLSAVAEFVTRRCTDEHPDWACDDWDATAAEIAAALNISHHRATTLMNLAITVRERFPKVGALVLAGAITAHTAQLIADRTYLVFNPEAIATLDARIADQAHTWGPLSDYKLIQSLDMLVDEIDPGALRRTTGNARHRDITIADPDEQSGTTALWGRLLATDAAALDKRLTAMATAVCTGDPRTVAQRRADALGALANKADHLACLCGSPECPATADDGRATNVIVHVVAEHATLTTPADAGESLHGEEPAEPEPAPPAPPAPSGPRPKPALLVEGRGGIIPAPLLQDLIARGARVRPVPTPTAAEPRYRPSAALATFVRLRDLTCRFPGCPRPAFATDIDHTRPYPHGPTHPANLGCYCRKHHLAKTFWPGWHDEQLPDGTIVITTPPTPTGPNPVPHCCSPTGTPTPPHHPPTPRPHHHRRKTHPGGP
ncbi:HNH endonuclease [Mycolicibacterium chitae]|uniref:HNH endonuclease signature motif containing protein n=1 Tax=Mycolicibacterium chitae TaxID=1792 RepID=UPI00138CC312|nr:HNH endonuclease signature motif containing protein [Mycolicibacterium chitae]BBZ05771.1 HNH endonuclease [Mycolicibacterium chitae]